MDSATVLAVVVERYGVENVRTVGFKYGSKHNPYENEMASDTAIHWGVPFRLIDLSLIMDEFESDLLLTGGEIPEGHYEEKSMEQTVVPGRNMIFISVLSGLAWTWGMNEVWMGIHGGDHAIYPDCRPEFFWRMSRAVLLGTDRRVKLVAPFLHGNKTLIIRAGLKLEVPYDLTRTCYKDQVIACGRCGSCQERLEAWHNVGLQDPLSYVLKDILVKLEE